MRTLDEVIEAERHCIGNGCRGCPYDIVTYGGSCECDEDALYYLEKYRDNFEARNDQVERYQKAAKDCEEILTDYVALKQYWAEQQENEPLSWDELRQMEGMPVWIEIGLLPPRWFLIEGFNGDQMVGVDALSVRVPFYKDGFGPGRCQAYRKERHETGD